MTVRWQFIAALIAANAIAVMLTGCTSPKQPIVTKATQVAIQGEDDVISDLAELAKQGKLDESAAIATSRPYQALTNLATGYDKINKLEKRHGQNQQLFGITKQYIGEQQGIGNVLLDEAGKADAAAKAKGK